MVDDSAKLPPERTKFVYITLEKGFTADGGERTVLCHWTAGGKHVNHGTGPPATRKNFIDAIEKMDLTDLLTAIP